MSIGWGPDGAMPVVNYWFLKDGKSGSRIGPAF